MAAAAGNTPETQQAICIDAAFPGGNIMVDRIEGDQVFLRPDRRDTPRWWFYWYFRVRGAAGRMVTFTFTDGNPIGVRGPAFSTDGGRTWSWLGTESVQGASFCYRFPPNPDEVRFSVTIPYLEADLRAFVRSLPTGPDLRIDSLCRTPKGRKVEILHVGRLDGGCAGRILLVARHHACETIASFVLEGFVRGLLVDEGDAARRWLRENVESLVVPFADKDGVEDGDQGKARAPHDPYMDYNRKSIYPVPAALRERVPPWAEGKLRIALDLHCPSIRGGRNETVFMAGVPGEGAWRNLQRFSGILESLPSKGLPYHAKDNLPWGQEWNTPDKLGAGKSFPVWVCELPGVELAATLEIPYANASGAAVTPEAARAFGRDLARVIARYFCRQGG